MDSGGARLLRQPRDVAFDGLALAQQQVGQLVDDDHDLGQPAMLDRLAILRAGTAGAFLDQIDRLQLDHLAGGAERAVVAVNIAHAHVAHHPIARLHLLRRPQKRRRRLFRIDYHRHEQMRDVLVDRQFEHLGIDQDEAHVVGGRVEENRRDHRVDRHRLAGPGRARDQQMRHHREIGRHRTSRNILAERDRELAASGRELFGLHDLAQINLLALAIGNLDSDHRLARHRGLDSHGGCAQRHREIVGQVHDLAHLDSRAGLELVHRDHRPRLDLDHAPLDTEIVELLLQHARAALERGLVDVRMFGRRHIEQR